VECGFQGKCPIMPACSLQIVYSIHIAHYQHARTPVPEVPCANQPKIKKTIFLGYKL
jgi:hypothetical protein